VKKLKISTVVGPVFIFHDSFVLSGPCRSKLTKVLRDYRRMLKLLEDNDQWASLPAENQLKIMDRFQANLGEQLLILRWHLVEASHHKEK
jgi:hypothetical protein